MQPAFLVSRVGGISGTAGSYIEIIVTDREQSFVLRGCAVTRRLPLLPNVRVVLLGGLRSLIITITSIFYGANFRSCWHDVSLLRRKRKEGTTRSGIAENRTGFAQFGQILSRLSMFRGGAISNGKYSLHCIFRNTIND